MDSRNTHLKGTRWKNLSRNVHGEVVLRQYSEHNAEQQEQYFLGCFGEIGGEWICLGVVDLLGIISFFLLSLVVRTLVVGYLKDTNAGEWQVSSLPLD